MAPRITTPLIVLCLACGGLSGRAERNAAGGGGEAASPAGAAGAMAGATSGGSAGDESCPVETQPYCLVNCQMVGDVDDPRSTCEQGVWRCLEGATPFEECPPGTCLVHYATCCDPSNGTYSSAMCGPSGYGERCSAGLIRVGRGGPCVQAPGQACGETQADTEGKPCPIEHADCLYDLPCGTQACVCRLGDDGLVWDCSDKCL